LCSRSYLLSVLYVGNKLAGCDDLQLVLAKNWNGIPPIRRRPTDPKRIGKRLSASEMSNCGLCFHSGIVSTMTAKVKRSFPRRQPAAREKST